MKSKRVRSINKPGFGSIIIFIVLVLTFALGGVAQAAPINQGGTTSVGISYKLIASPRVISLCTGEVGIVQVFEERTIERIENNPSHELVFGARILGFVSDINIASLSTTAKSTITNSLVPRARFEVVAGKPGQTTIEFAAKTNGEEANYGNIPVDDTNTTVQVEVTSCYEATQSAAGDEWPIKDVCSLERPFVLQGKFFLQVFGGGSVENNAKVMFFVPRRNTILEGRYAYVADQVYTAPDGTSFQGIQFGSGAYSLDVQPQEANITLADDYTACTPGYCSVNLQDYKILLKPLPSGQACEGELP